MQQSALVTELGPNKADSDSMSGASYRYMSADRSMYQDENLLNFQSPQLLR